MICRAPARRYALALFHSDEGPDAYRRRLSQFDTLLTLLQRHPKLDTLLSSPQLSYHERKSLMEQCLPVAADGVLRRFLSLMLREGRFHCLREVAVHYRRLADAHMGLWEATLVSAFPIDQDAEEQLRQKLEDHYDKKIKFDKQINPALGGGAVLLMGNKMIDWSVSGRLRRLRDNLLATSIAQE